jgi:two-component system CheB/CheR fusion protein
MSMEPLPPESDKLNQDGADAPTDLLNDVQDADFEHLLEYLKHSRGFDFSGYKRTSLRRRFQKRLQTIAIKTYSDYLDFLEVHPDEFSALFNTVLINVSSFFRDQTTWDHLRSEVLPAILAKKGDQEPIRVWSAGCASGEEPYTIAILLAEALGEAKFRERVKIYATDIDEQALDHARRATYTLQDVVTLPVELRERYFEASESHFSFRKEFRRSVIFGRHDLLQDAPISRIDLLICRNTLMYFNVEAQNRILTRFHWALADGAYLFLGKAEMLLTHTHLFSPVDLKRRLFIKVQKAYFRDRLLTMAQSDDEESNSSITKFVRFREAAFDANPVAQLVIDLNGFLALANERARIFFNLTTRDINRSLQDLELAYRIRELRPRIDEASQQRRPVTIPQLAWTTASGDVRDLEVQIVPLSDTNHQLLGVSLSFTDVTPTRRLHEKLEHANQELETAYEELQSTNEELETTNEELQSTVEELETTNEELQSTNEELETMNEELQPTNEELQTVNEELRRRTEENSQVNIFLESILSNLRVGVVVLDRNLQIQVWNRKVEDLWGLRADEAQHQNFLNLDIGLPVERLKQPIRACLAQETEDQEVVLETTNRRGKPMQCRVNCTTFKGSDQNPRGIILLIEEQVNTPIPPDGKQDSSTNTPNTLESKVNTQIPFDGKQDSGD